MKYIKLYETYKGNDEYTDETDIERFEQDLKELSDILFFNIHFKSEKLKVMGEIRVYTLGSIINKNVISLFFQKQHGFVRDIINIRLNDNAIRDKKSLIYNIICVLKYDDDIISKIIDNTPDMYNVLYDMLSDELKNKYNYIKNELF